MQTISREGRTVSSEPSEAIRQTPSNRAEAVSVGSPTYQGKKVCRQCGGTERFTRTYRCVNCTPRIEAERAGDAKRYYHKARQPLDGREFVYECYDARGELIYVGRTNNPRNRVYTHRRETPWWPEVYRMTWVQVPDLERERIMALRPRYNKHGN